MPQIYDMGPTALLPLWRMAYWGFFRPKNPTASAGFEPANLGTKGQHATPRPPKPFFRFRKYVSCSFPIIHFCNPEVQYETPCIFCYLPVLSMWVAYGCYVEHLTKKLNEMNRCFENETCASTRNKHGAYLWPFRIQQFDQNCFYRPKSDVASSFFQCRENKKGTTTEAKLEKKKKLQVSFSN